MDNDAPVVVPAPGAVLPVVSPARFIGTRAQDSDVTAVYDNVRVGTQP